MNVFIAIVLGILQGLTEFLPVSSSGHLVLAEYFLKVKQSSDILFELFLHLGTVLAVLVYFRKKIWDLLVSLLKWRNTVDNLTHRHNRTMLLYLIIATIATGIVYLIAGDFLESLFGKPLVVALMLVVTGVIVFTSDLFKNGNIPSSQMGIIRSSIIGICQGIAIIPGISRSGTTIMTSLAIGVERRDAAEFAFLLSIPAILGGLIVKLSHFGGLGADKMLAYFAGMIAAFLVAFAVIGVLLQLIARAKLKYFAFYCWAVGGLCFILLLSGK
jgi:undecaprenyl-diphosphatase